MTETVLPRALPDDAQVAPHELPQKSRGVLTYGLLEKRFGELLDQTNKKIADEEENESYLLDLADILTDALQLITRGLRGDADVPSPADVRLHTQQEVNEARAKYLSSESEASGSEEEDAPQHDQTDTSGENEEASPDTVAQNEYIDLLKAWKTGYLRSLNRQSEIVDDVTTIFDKYINRCRNRIWSDDATQRKNEEKKNTEEMTVALAAITKKPMTAGATGTTKPPETGKLNRPSVKYNEDDEEEDTEITDPSPITPDVVPSPSTEPDTSTPSTPTPSPRPRAPPANVANSAAMQSHTGGTTSLVPLGRDKNGHGKYPQRDAASPSPINTGERGLRHSPSSDPIKRKRNSVAIAHDQESTEPTSKRVKPIPTLDANMIPALAFYQGVQWAASNLRDNCPADLKHQADEIMSELAEHARTELDIPMNDEGSPVSASASSGPPLLQQLEEAVSQAQADIHPREDDSAGISAAALIQRAVIESVEKDYAGGVLFPDSLKAFAEQNHVKIEGAGAGVRTLRTEEARKSV